MNLTKKQKAAIIGMVLGDGYLQKTGQLNARLRLEHSLKQQNYLIWKINLLPCLFQGKYSIIHRRHPISEKTYSYIRHQSNASPYLGKVRKIFYSDGQKKIPEELEKFLVDEIALAIWYLDDGYYCRRDNSMYIYLGKVSEVEAKIISKSIFNVFNIKNTILNKKSKGFVIYISPRKIKKVVEIVQKYMPESMAYKLPSNPVTTF